MRRSALFALLVLIALPCSLNGMEAAVDSCPLDNSPPLLRRKSIVIRNGHFGQGTMELIGGVTILRLHGTPYEMGYQHGAMLKDEIRQRITAIENKGGTSLLQRTRSLVAYRTTWPEWARREIEGMSAGSGIARSDLIFLNSVDPAEPYTVQSPGNSLLEGRVRPPAWMIVIYHPLQGGKTAAVTRPGSVGAVAGVRESSCCLCSAGKDKGGASGGRLPPSLALRRSLALGSCGVSGSDVQSGCTVEVEDEAGPVTIGLDSTRGLLCIGRGEDKPADAVSLEDESLHPGCGLCGG